MQEKSSELESSKSNGQNGEKGNGKENRIFTRSKEELKAELNKRLGVVAENNAKSQKEKKAKLVDFIDDSDEALESALDELTKELNKMSDLTDNEEKSY